MNEKLSLSIILPIKSSKSRDFNEYFEKAITSIKSQTVDIEELVIVHSSEESLVEHLNGYDFGTLNVTKLLWDKEPSYAEQVNYGIKNAKGTWISLFEFDDEYASIWFKNVKKYIDSYPETQVFLPVVVETDEKGLFAGFTNEATCAANFSQEMGFLTNETLQDYQNFQTAGAVIKKQVIEDFGGFKPSIKLTFAIITVALICGSVVERINFGALFIFVILWSILVYAPVGHMVWGGGYLSKMGVLDFAGGTVVHINSGIAGLVAALVIGKRKSKARPHNVALTMIGASMLWVGWFGTLLSTITPCPCLIRFRL